MYRPIVSATVLALAYSLCVASIISWFQAWCSLQLLGLCTNVRSQLRFYAWWSRSELAEANRRGLSTYGYPWMGLVLIPKLSPKALLCVTGTYATVLVSLVLEVNNSATTITRQGACFFALVLACLYHGSLWAEQTSAYHRETLTIVIWMYASVCTDDKVMAVLMRAHLASVYGASVLQKVVCSLYNGGIFWAQWSPHAFLWKAMWSRPLFPTIQAFVFLRPWLSCLGGLLSLVAESMPLIILILGREEQHAAYCGALLISFHVAVYLLQGIDYVTFWAPALLVLAADKGKEGLADCPWLGIAFLVLQSLYALCMAETWNINVPPLTSAPMFVTLARLDDRQPQHYVITDRRQHTTTSQTYDRIEWMYPYLKEETGLGLNPRDELAMPMYYVAFGHTNTERGQGIPNFFHQWFTDTASGCYILTNMDLPTAFRERLERLMLDLHSENSSYDPYGNLGPLHNICRDLRAEFAFHVRRLEKKET